MKNKERKNQNVRTKFFLNEEELIQKAKEEVELGLAEDLTNLTFGFLQPIYRVKNIGKHTAWKCRCLKCGKLINKRVDHLKEKRVISCGCYNSEKAKEHIKNINYKGKNAKDITGMVSGYLQTLYPTEERISYSKNDSKVIWQCICNSPFHNSPVYCTASTTDITTKNKLSCGCLKTSFGEAKIEEILKNNNIFFEKEKKFKDFKSEKNCYFRFDFYVNNCYLIEFDGIQHFKEGHWKETLETTQKRDEIKNQYCKINNIPLIRIPYTIVNDIKLEDLLLESSKYRIV